MNSANLYAPPKSKVDDVGTRLQPADIDSLPVSQKWKARFHIICAAGGPKLPRFKELAVGERRKIGFNIPAFLFGPLYYLAKGMWRKAISLFVVCFAALTAVSVILELLGHGDIARAFRYATGAVFAARANIDFYKKMVLKENGWW